MESERGELESLSLSAKAGCFRDSAKALRAECRLIVSDGESWSESCPDMLFGVISPPFLANASKEFLPPCKPEDLAVCAPDIDLQVQVKPVGWSAVVSQVIGRTLALMEACRGCASLSASCTFEQMNQGKGSPL